MEKKAGDYLLWMLCMDDTAYEVLLKLQLNNVRLLQLSEVETPELLAIKKERSSMEYCWTLTPFTTKFVFDRESNVTRATYIDADMWMRKNPSPIFLELEESDKSVLITDHNYDPRFDQSEESGQYNVQFITFYQKGGEEVRKWWEKRCIEWCFARFEDGKFGDQKYLDNWPDKFRNKVHVLQNKELFLAPWNAYRFPIGNCVVYHFQGLRLLKNGKILPGGKPLPLSLLKGIYKPYMQVLSEKVKLLKSIGFTVRPQKNHSIVFRFIKRRYDEIEEWLWRLSFRNRKYF
jgi:hypothetical protein